VGGGGEMRAGLGDGCWFGGGDDLIHTSSNLRSHITISRIATTQMVNNPHDYEFTLLST